MSKVLQYIGIFIFIAIDIAYAAAQGPSHGYSPTGNLKYPKNFSHFEYVNPNAPKGGKLRRGIVGTFDSLNPFTLKGSKLPDYRYLFDSLLVSSNDELTSKYGLLAESLEIQENNEWVDFNLRKEAHWHDKSAITAEDVVFSFYTLKEKGDIQYKIIYADIGKAEALSKYTVRFYFKNPNNFLLVSLIGGMPIISKKFFKDKDFTKYENKPMLSSGPYKIKEYSFGKHITYERVKDYWAKDLSVRKGLYNFDEVEYTYYRNDDVAVQALKAGEYDLRHENTSRLWGTAYNTKEVQEGKLIKASFENKLPANLQLIYFNLRYPIFKDIALRKALTLAFDFNWMNKYFFYNIYQRTESYYHNSQYAAKGLPSEKELEILQQFKGQIPDAVFTKPFLMPTTNASPETNRANLRKAKEILLSTGYKYKNGKLISFITNKPIEIEVIYVSASHEKIFAAYKNNLKKIGITLKLKQIDFAQAEKRFQDMDFEMAMATFIPGFIPYIDQKQFWHSHSDTPGGYNIGGIHDKAIDKLIETLLNTKNAKDIFIITRALDRILLWNYYTIPTLHSNKYRFIYWNKFEMPKKRPDYSEGIDTWWNKDLSK